MTVFVEDVARHRAREATRAETEAWMRRPFSIFSLTPPPMPRPRHPFECWPPAMVAGDILLDLEPHEKLIEGFNDLWWVREFCRNA